MKTTIKKMTPAQYKAVFTCLVEQLRGKKLYFEDMSYGKSVKTDKSLIENKWSYNGPKKAKTLGEGVFYNTCKNVKAIWKRVEHGNSYCHEIMEIDILSLYSYSNGPSLIQEALQASQDRVTLEMNAYESIVKLEARQIISKSKNQNVKYYSAYRNSEIKHLERDIKSSALRSVLSGLEPVQNYSPNL
jgi:hypothetical protein